MLKGLSDLCDKKFTLLLFSVIILLTAVAWSNRFIQDDAYISFRYAYNLAHGNGLVWNPGERVEGYTNFLWTLLISIPFFLNLDSVYFSYIIGMIFFVLSLIFTYKLSFQLFYSRYISLLVLGFLGTNYTFSAYATSGMETQLQAFIFTSSIYMTLRGIHSSMWSIKKLIALSLLLAAALLIRPDSAILIAGILPVSCYSIFKQNIPLKNKISHITWLILPVFIIVGSWIVWKYVYYGDIMPNTFYAKVSSSTSIFRGIQYIYMFMFSYWLIPFLFIFMFASGRVIYKFGSSLLFIVMIIALWFLYVITVGGDFMEYRFIVPVLPLLFILITSLLFFFIQNKEIRIALIAMVFIGSIIHAVDFGNTFAGTDIERISQLEGHVKNEDENWEEIGKVLGRLFENKNVIIATTAAGSIPFYSHLETVDMHGLNDKWIAKHGRINSTRPGHQRIATLEYLLSRKVNILIGHPKMRRYSQKTAPVVSLEDYNVYDVTAEKINKIPRELKILEIPINYKYKLIALYFEQSKYIDELIKQKKITAVDVQYVSE